MSLLSPKLQAFVSVAENNTVHGAAKLLFLTQTAVTQRIRNLEKQLKTSLFTRTRRGMRLTAEGEALLRYCHACKDLEGETLAQIKGAAIDSLISVTISGPTSIMASRIVPHCAPVLNKFPNLLMHFDISDRNDHALALRTGKSQFAILQQEENLGELEYKALKPEQYVLVCTHKWQERHLKEIIKNERIIDYNPADQMTLNYLKEYDLYELASHERHFVNRTESLAIMIAAGLGYGLLTREFSQPYIDNQQLIVLNNGKIYNNHMVLAWYTRPEPPKYFTALISHIH